MVIVFGLAAQLKAEFNDSFSLPNTPSTKAQEILAKDNLRLIVIYFMPDVWQQEFELKNEKNKKQMIRLFLTYF